MGSASQRYTRRMKNLRLPLLFLALAAMTLLAACGNKGELVRPGEANPPAQH